MQILSASDAISPAIARTRLILFTPFRKGRSWKLGATAYLSFVGTLFLPFPLMYAAAAPLLARTAGRNFAIALVVVSIVATLLYAWLFTACSRLQFAFFDIVLNRGEFVAPAWRKYGAVSRPWTLIKFAAGLLFTLLSVGLAIPLARKVMAAMVTLPELMKNMQPGQPPPPEMFNFMVGLYGSMFAFVLLIGFFYLVMGTASAFMVPSMALEGLSPRAAFARLSTLMQRETKAFIGFVLLRLGLGVAGYMGFSFAYQMVLLLLMLIVGLICALIGLLLHALGVPSSVLVALGVLALMFFTFIVNGYLMILMLGAFFTFFEAHTLYFLAGRYPLLGDLLERSTPPPTFLPPPQPPYGWAPPPFPPPQG